MTAISFSNLVVVAAVAFMAPLVLGQFPRLRLPSVVLELVLGIAIGPSGLGWVHSDVPVKVLSLVGLAFLLFLAGLDVELERLRGRNQPKITRRCASQRGIATPCARSDRFAIPSLLESCYQPRRSGWLPPS